MPCFKGLAVSIHTPSGPLPEFSVQRSTRLSRISSYIPVPPPKIADASNAKPEQSTFAISITLLTPGQDVPYSTPKPSSENPYPKAQTVGNLPGSSSERGRFTTAVGPYIPLTASVNETIAAYIYFDGRAKEEVATLLRRGEETWVNSRWVGVPESEGGGLAEREFLFREVGLERWLNGLDLEGKDAAAKLERRRQKMEKRRQRRKAAGSDDEDGKSHTRKSILRYGGSTESPVEKLSDDDDLSGTSSSEDDDPMPEAAGQIKVALFRVLASGEIKRGEYSPQFDAHDDDEEAQGRQTGDGQNGADLDHTTSFAKPKTLDPKTISTQTVTGIDPTDKPYATFTFLYRGERQLQKMGILPTKPEKTPLATKRRSGPLDFSTLSPLKKEGTVGFTGFRDGGRARSSNLAKNKDDDDEMDSDSDGDRRMPKDDDDEPKAESNDLLSPEDTERSGQLAEGVRKIKLKRAHSAEPEDTSTDHNKTSKSASPTADVQRSASDDLTHGPPKLQSSTSAPLNPLLESLNGMPEVVGSPVKRQRASLPGWQDDSIEKRIGKDPLSGNVLGELLGSGSGNGLAGNGAEKEKFGGLLETGKVKDGDDEEL